MFPKTDQKSLVEFYGDPDATDDGLPDALWESAHLTIIEPPYPMVWAWNNKSIRSIRVHKKCHLAFLNMMTGWSKHFTPDQLTLFKLNRCGGAYNFRTKRTNPSSLSLHAYGAAIDFAPEVNWLGRKHDARLGMMPDKAIQIAMDYGLRWGGLFRPSPDSMHFEATTKP